MHGAEDWVLGFSVGNCSCACLWLGDRIKTIRNLYRRKTGRKIENLINLWPSSVYWKSFCWGRKRNVLEANCFVQMTGWKWDFSQMSTKIFVNYSKNIEWVLLWKRSYFRRYFRRQVSVICWCIFYAFVGRMEIDIDDFFTEVV